jgi:hypothetical protein
MPRTTAIVRVTRHDDGCTCDRPGPSPHPLYVARCADCGWEASGCVRVVLDAAGTGMVQRHRVSCPKRPGVAG